MIAEFFPGLLIFVYVFLFLVQPHILSSIAIALGLLFYFWGWRSFFRQWLILGIPLSRIRSVAAGLVKLKGKALPVERAAKLPGFIYGCDWINPTNIEEIRWRKIADGYAREPFYLDDGSGKLLVIPDNAEVLGVESKLVWPFNNFRLMRDIARACSRYGLEFPFEEIQYPDAGRIREGDQLVIIGEARSLGGTNRRWQSRISVLLRKWLRDPGFRREMDLNKDGYIDEIELEEAKRKASDQVANETISNDSSGPTIVICHPRKGIFLLSKGNEADILEGEGRPAVTIILSSFLIFVGLLYLPRAYFMKGMVVAFAGALAIILSMAFWRILLIKLRKWDGN